jgi:DNA-binding response OmpR family regulator
MRGPNSDEYAAFKKALRLTAGETNILMALYRAKGRPLSWEYLLERQNVFRARESGRKVVHVLVFRIRKKFSPVNVIETIVPYNYRITDEGREKISLILTEYALKAS